MNKETNYWKTAEQMNGRLAMMGFFAAVINYGFTGWIVPGIVQESTCKLSSASPFIASERLFDLRNNYLFSRDRLSHDRLLKTEPWLPLSISQRLRNIRTMFKIFRTKWFKSAPVVAKLWLSSTEVILIGVNYVAPDYLFMPMS